VKKRVPKAATTDEADADAFAREMADVVPLRRDPRGRTRARPPAAQPPPKAPPSRPASDLEDPDADFAAPGIDRREIRKLTRGEYRVTARRDLHGTTTSEADAIVRRFIDSSRHDGHRCVCIVHGRGLHSEGNVAILKTRVRGRLRMDASVLAYADAPRSDGGAGAVYVLLRK
jgi:DNA-nicking Smr family endonuclease